MSSTADGADFAESSKASDDAALTFSQVTELIQALINLFSSAKASIPISPPNTDATAAAASSSERNRNIINCSSKNYQKLCDQLSKWEADLKYIRSSMGNLQDLVLNVRKQFRDLRRQGKALDTDLKKLLQDPDSITLLKAKEMEANVLLITEMIMKLKHHIPYPQKMSLGSDNDGVRTVRNVRNLFDVLLQLDAYKKFRGQPAVEDFEADFDTLEPVLQRCLLCFSVFQADAVISKRLLKYWWLGEGLIHDHFQMEIGVDDDPWEIISFPDWPPTAEQVADWILSKFCRKGYIEPVLDKGKLIGFRMHPLIRFAVIFLAEKLEFFSFDSTWNPTWDFKSCGRAVLMGRNEDENSPKMVLVENEEGNSSKMVMSLNPENLIALFNISDRFADLKMEWFLRARNAKVIFLGSWKENSSRPIEAEDTKFLKGLKNMNRLMFLSFQGVSKVDKLPEEVLKLTDLIILDLKACKDLGALPDSIGLLSKLTHLDVSKCESLNRMPKRIDLLQKLEVLKGFVVADEKTKDSGSISDLSSLSNLRKLTIRTNKRDFPTDEELDDLCRCESLQNLTIAWTGTYAPRTVSLPTTLAAFKLNTGVESFIEETIIRLDKIRSPNVPAKLEKLDLQCFPEAHAPRWLMPSKFKSLQKLYIRKGNLRFLNQAPDEDEDDKWNVKILRLQELSELRMHWTERQNTFPELIYLEKVDCRWLSSFPCDERGVWLNRNMIRVQEQSLKGLGLRWSFLSTYAS